MVLRHGAGPGPRAVHPPRRVTGDDAWRTAADRTFASFLVGRRTGGPWVSEKDADGHLWLEEYAAPTGKPAPDRTFNGHNFAISGLYEYYE